MRAFEYDKPDNLLKAKFQTDPLPYLMFFAVEKISFLDRFEVFV